MEPPRQAQGMPLFGEMDLIDDGVHHAIREFLGTVGQPGQGDPFEVAIRCHARRSVDGTVRASASIAARRVCVA